MHQQPHDQPSVRAPPFQARVLYFLKKLAFRGRSSAKRSKDTVPPVTIPTQDFQRAHSSVDLLRKPGLSRFIGFRAEDGPNLMDTDDSSQDAASPAIRPRRHSAWDSLRTVPTHSTFSGHSPPLLFSPDRTSPRKAILDDHGSHAPAPLFMRTSTSLDTPAQPPQSSELAPEIQPQITIVPESQLHEVPARDMPSNDTPRPSGDLLPHNDTFTTSFTDIAPSASSDPGASSRTQSLLSPEDSSSGVLEHPTLLHHGASLPPLFRRASERGLRLSPSIIARQPIPLLNLPALPPPPPVPHTPPRQRIPLRSMPSLSRHGHSIEDVDLEDATLDDSDEDDVDEAGGDEAEFIDASSCHQSDDEDDEPPSAGSSGTQGFRSSQKRPARDEESLTETPISPTSPSIASCYRSETYVQSAHVVPSSTSLKMYPFSPSIPKVGSTSQRHVVDPDLPIPGALLESKPSLYRAASRSMINLGSTRRAERHLSPREVVESNPASVSGHTAESHEELEESDTEAMVGRLRRRTSMPSFHPTSDPPPYPTFDPRPKESRVAPRDDEGRERLPLYSNSLYLIAIMPRKMEFSSPGVQAKDRKWRRVLCELEGTTFRVYKCPPGASGGGVLGDWWEKHVGAGDVAGPNPPRARRKGPEGQPERPAKLEIDESSTPVAPLASSSRSASISPEMQRTRSQSPSTTPTTMTPKRAKRMSTASFLSPFRSSSNGRPEASAGETSRTESRELELLPVDMQDSRSSLSHESTRRAARRLSQPLPPRSASRHTFLPTTSRMQWRNGEIPKPPKSDLMRAYTLQHAESGLGNDYLKRKNVIRVRLEGEQFLLQAPHIPAVVEWIEGLHAGTNIALDIDQRQMPKGPMFPRRRRRRTRRAENTSRPHVS